MNRCASLLDALEEMHGFRVMPLVAAALIHLDAHPELQQQWDEHEDRFWASLKSKAKPVVAKQMRMAGV